MLAAKDETVFPLAAFAQNSHPAHQLPTAIRHPGFGFVISNTAISFQGSLYDFRRGPRCSSKERDSETGLDYFGARYFSSAQGRFTSADPKQFTARTIANPQKWNKYAYVRNNPLALIDPDGLDDFAVFLGFQNAQLQGAERPDWAGIKANAEARGHNVSIYEGDQANKENYLGAVATTGMNVVFIGHTVDIDNAAKGIALDDAGVGTSTTTYLGQRMSFPTMVDANSVNLFGCNTTMLNYQYAQAPTFTGVQSGTDGTNSITLERAGAAFLTSATSRASDPNKPANLATAAAAAQGAVSNSNILTKQPDGSVKNIDKGDKVLQNQP